MTEGVIRTIQKFLNTPFRYGELLAVLDKQKDLLLREAVMDSIPDTQYNALWDMIGWLEQRYKYGDRDNTIIGARVSVLLVYDTHLKQRKSLRKF